MNDRTPSDLTTDNLPGPAIPMQSAAPSSNVHSFGYDVDRKLLRIHFMTGAIFDYYDVSAEVASALHISKSKGTYVRMNVTGQYRTVLVREKTARVAA